MLIIFYFKNNSKSVTQGNIKSRFDVKLMPGYFFLKMLSHIFTAQRRRVPIKKMAGLNQRTETLRWA